MSVERTGEGGAPDREYNEEQDYTTISQEQKKMIEQQVQNELMGFLKNESLPEFSNYKGSSYIYMMKNFSNPRSHLVEQL